MTSPLVEQIYKNFAKGARIIVPPANVPEHSHVMMIGCVDARINTREIRKSDGELLFPDGKKPIRNIAARIFPPNTPIGKKQHEMLRQAIEGGITVIDNVSHTHCGGIEACMEGASGLPNLKEYLAPLNPLRDEVLNPKAGIAARKQHAHERKALSPKDANLRDLEATSALDSAHNLQAHLDLLVEEGLERAKHVTINPYLLNTATQRVIDLKEGENYYVTDKPPLHQPEMLILTSSNEHLFPQDDLLIADGKALIHRTGHGQVMGREKANADERGIIEFALLKNVKDIVVMEKIMPGTPDEVRVKIETELCHRKEMLESYPELEKRVNSKGGDKISLHAWLLNERGRLLHANEAGMFVPVGNDRSR